MMLLQQQQQQRGKNAAIRQIMRERQQQQQGKKVPTLTSPPPPLPSPRNHDNPSFTESSPDMFQMIHNNDNETDAGIAHTVTFEEDAIAHNVLWQQQQQLSPTTKNLDLNTNEQNNLSEQLEESIMHASLSSSSYWALTEHCYGGGNDGTSPSTATSQNMTDYEFKSLLGTSLISISPESKESCASQLFPTENHHDTEEQPLKVPPTPPDDSTLQKEKQSSKDAHHRSDYYQKKIQALQEELEEWKQKAAKTSTKQPWESGMFTPTPLSIHSKKDPITITAPASCPSRMGTIHVDSESLWERNKTLVKEIRFADQTCVELASEKRALEQHVRYLKQQYQTTKSENETLQQQVIEATRQAMRAQTQLEQYQQTTADRKILQNNTNGKPSEQEEEEGDDQMAKNLEAAVDAKQGMEALESKLESVRAACQAGEMREAAAKECIDDLQRQLQTNIQEKEGLQQQIVRERLQFVQKIQTMSEWMSQQTLALTGTIREKFQTSNERISELAAVVQYLESEIDVTGESEDDEEVKQGAQSGANDDSASGHSSNSSSASSDESSSSSSTSTSQSSDTINNKFNATFTFSPNRRRSSELELMEEARANLTRSSQTSYQDVSTMTSSHEVDDDYDEDATTFVSPAKSSSLSTIDGFSNLLMDDPYDTAGSSNEFKIMQHLQWMTSPNGVQASKRDDEDPFEDQSGYQTDSSPSIKSVLLNATDQGATVSTPAKIRELERQVALLESKLQAREYEIEKLCEERETLTSTPWISSSSEETRNHDASVNDNHKRDASPCMSDGPPDEVKKLHDEILEVKRERDALRNEIAGKETLISEIENKREKMEQDIENFRQDIEALTKERDELKENLRQRADCLEKADKAVVENLNDRELNQQIGERNEVNDDSGPDDAKISLDAADSELSLLEKAENFDLENQCSNTIIASYTEMQKRIKSLEVERDDLVSQLEATSSSLDASQTKIDILQTEIVQLQGIIEERNVLRVRVDLLESEKLSLAEELSAKSKACSEDLQSLQERFELLQREKIQMEKKLTKKSIFPVARNMSNDGVALQSMKEANNELTAELKVVKSLLKEAQQKIATLEKIEADLESAVNERDAFKQQACILVAESQLQKEKIDDLTLKLEAARHDYESMIVRSDDKEQKLQQELLSVETSAQNLEKLMDARAVDLGKIQAENISLREELSKSRQACQQAQQKAAETFTRLVTVQKEFEQVEIDRNALILKLKDLITTLERFESEAARYSQALKESHDARETEKASFHSQIQQYEERLAETQNRSEALENKCQRLKDYIRKLTKKCDEWEAFHEQESAVLYRLKIAHDDTRQKAMEVARQYQAQDLVCMIRRC
jgi:peptidoglycan hydrolase CwlO-like protein